MKKRLIPLLLVLCLTLALLPARALAATTIKTLSLTYPVTPLSGRLATADPEQVTIREEGCYAFNVVWLNITDNYGCSGDHFQPGTRYQLSIQLLPMEGYVFAAPKDMTVTINGKTAKVYNTDDENARAVSLTFDAVSGTYTGVHKTNIPAANIIYPAPAEGNIAAADPAYAEIGETDYAVSAVSWRNVTDGVDCNGSTFKEGKEYQLQLTLQANADCWFPEQNFAAAVNGNLAECRDMTRDRKTVTVVYTFPKLTGRTTGSTVTRPDYRFTSQPKDGATTVGCGYEVKWYLSFAPETCYIERKQGDTWVRVADGNSLGGTLPLTWVRQTGTYRVMAQKGAYYIYSDEFTVTWNAEPQDPRREPFNDVFMGDAHYNAIVWAFWARPQVTDGIEPDMFGPNETVTRGQAVTFLWRAMGCPEPVSTYNPFDDVPEWEYYYKPVLWAVENGITDGTEPNLFEPDLTCATAHIVTFLYRTMKIGPDGWYEEAGSWAENSGLMGGLNLHVDPDTPCPRSIVVELLYRQVGKQ